MGYVFEALCAIAFVQLNLPVILQYFCCCRSLTKSATIAARSEEKIKELNMAADADENGEYTIDMT